MKSAHRIPHPRDGAEIVASTDVRLLLGTGTAGTPISWKCQPAPGKLSVQGPAGSGKTTLLTNLVSQAAEHLDVYAYLSDAAKPPCGLKAYGADPRSACELLLDVRESMRSARKQIQDYEDSFLTDEQRRNPLRLNLSPLLGIAPSIQRPMSAIVVMDDFDALYRDHARGSSYFEHPDCPYAIMDELARDGARAGISIVVAGRSLARSPLSKSRGVDSRLLLGPATLAEREAFLNTHVASLGIGEGLGLFEEAYVESAEVVRRATDPRSGN